jgi:DNA-binding LacI/PurR family transcriptional regulator
LTLGFGAHLVVGKKQRKASPTLLDVAEHVKLSVATVGRALGGYGRVSATARAKVLKAAAELNYHPNAIARGMKEQRTKTIGLIVGNIMNPFFSTIVRAVEDTVSGQGFNVIVCNTDEEPAKELAHARNLYERRVDGLVIAPTVFDDPKVRENVKLYYGRQIPVVFVDRRMDDIEAPVVYTDNIEGAYQAAVHLLQLGHRRIGVVVGKRSLTTMSDRISGYLRGLNEAGIDSEERLIQDAAAYADVGVEGGYLATQRLLALPEPPTALLVMNNLLVLGALRALTEAKVKVPLDMSLITWDDFELAPLLPTPLSVVDQPTYTMGALAAERLLKGIAHNERPEGLEVVLKPKLLIRDSTARPRTASTRDGRRQVLSEG